MTDHERQGTSFDPDAHGHELQGRDIDPKILVRRALLAEHERQLAEPPCDRCGRPRSNVTIAGAPARTRRSGRVDAPLEAPAPAPALCRCPPQREEGIMSGEITVDGPMAGPIDLTGWYRVVDPDETVVAYVPNKIGAVILAGTLNDARPTIYAGVDLSTGPDQGGYLCGQCGFESSDVDAMLAHDCPNRPGDIRDTLV